ncbi:MAG TPA: RNA polymerase sigma factor [Candidatus Dormibacteraeota bacterium]|nr:RNA polymerase sigma factor [Candidatus Dormibacteraeota bacterium]
MAAIEYRPGSEADFDRLYRDERGKLLQTIRAIVGEDAEDCVQDAFVEAFRNWRSYRPEAPASAWLHRIAINRAISMRRRQKLRSATEMVRRLGRPEAQPDPGQMATSFDLARALRRLPPRQAAVIVLRHLHGYSNRDIGVALGVPERTVASRLGAAKVKLLIELGPESSRASVPEPSLRHIPLMADSRAGQE